MPRMYVWFCWLLGFWWSRFHALSEFDQKKRSCRRRLSDHNARRRKPQPDAYAFASARLPSSLFGNFSCLNSVCHLPSVDTGWVSSASITLELDVWNLLCKWKVFYLWYLIISWLTVMLNGIEYTLGMIFESTMISNVYHVLHISYCHVSAILPSYLLFKIKCSYPWIFLPLQMIGGK